MLSFNHRILLIACVALAGCGFQPAYGPGGAAEGLRGSIDVDAPTERDSYALVKQLESRLGQPITPQYGLSYKISTNQDDLAITPEQEITRYNVLGSIDFEITDLASQASLFSSSVSSFTAYSATGTTVSTLTAERDAYARLMIILADQMTSKLIATADSWHQ